MVLALTILSAALSVLPSSAQSGCHTTEANVRVSVPGRPYAAVASADGCSIFVSLQNSPNPGSIVNVAFEGGTFVLRNSAALKIQPAGLALTHDGKLLIAPGVDGVAFIDTELLARGSSDSVLGTLNDGGKGPIQAVVSKDDKFLFVSDERSNTITTIDLSKARASGFKPDSIVGKIPTGTQPVGLALSTDQRFLYSSVEVAKEATAGSPCAETAEGVFTVIDANKAKTSPATAVIAELHAGCRPVRVVLSSDGARAYVAARASNEIVFFDTATARANSKSARLGSIKLPSSAIGLALTHDGSHLLASNGSTLTVIDTAKSPIGNDSIKTTAPTSGAGRELFITSDNRTVLLTNNAASLLEIIDLTRLLR